MEPKGFVQLRIIIIGAGIAGFASAVMLRNAGHKVKIIEKSNFTREAGFGISIAPNASKILDTINFDFSKASAVPCEAIVVRDPKTLETRIDYRLEDQFEKWGGAWYLILRPDIHNELKRLALIDDGRSPTPELILGAKVVDVDIERGTVALNDGTEYSADLIIGADGEQVPYPGLLLISFFPSDVLIARKSQVQKQVSTTPSRLRESTVGIFRNIIPTRDILADPVTNKVYQSRKNTFCMFIDESGKSSLTWFECRDGTLQDIEATYLLHKPDGSRKVFDEAKLKEQMLHEFRNFHPDLLQALKKATTITNWTINFAQPLSNWTKAKGVILGDAAHSMFPTTGQGGCQSIEDAGALGVLLSELPDVNQLSERLKLFEQVRRGRASTMQAMSSTFFGAENRVHPKMYKYLPGGGPFSSFERYQDFSNAYDVIAESRKVLDATRRKKTKARL
ncbi:hypothetical protein FQN57_005490 [Myotisia sp. PD_48]|nr:hypothetical protein FQN57_005490 [Myotisia sp. PD_48]